MHNSSDKQDLILATTNTERFNKHKDILDYYFSDFFSVVGLMEMLKQGKPPAPHETGKTEIENAELKVQYYGSHFQKLVLSFDNGIYIDDVANENQIGVHMNRFLDKNLEHEQSKKETFSFWLNLVNKEKKISGYLKRAYALYRHGSVFSEEIEIPFVLAKPSTIFDKPSEKCLNPLNFFMIPEGSHKTFHDFSETDRKSHNEQFILPILTKIFTTSKVI